MMYQAVLFPCMTIIDFIKDTVASDSYILIAIIKWLCKKIVCENGTSDEDIIDLCEGYWEDDLPARNVSVPPVLDFVDVSEGSKTVLSILYGLSIVLALVGNVVVLVMFCSMRSFRSVTNVLILNLAISDLLITIFCMPFNLLIVHKRTWDFGSVSEISCKLVPYMQTLSVVASILTLACIAAERYVAIILPLKARTMHTMWRTMLLVIYIWLIAILFAVPNALWYSLIDLKDIDYSPESIFSLLKASLFDKDNDSRKTTTVTVLPSMTQTTTTAPCPWDPENDIPVISSAYLCVLSSIDVEKMKIYQYMFFSILFVFPLITMVFIYSEVGYRLWVRHTIGNQSVTYDQMRLRTSKRVVAMLVTVLLLFVFCWAPLQIFTLYTFIANPQTTETNLNLKYYFQWLALTNSACNPLVYTFLHEKFRKRICRGRCCGCCKKGTVQPSTSSDQQRVQQVNQPNSSNGTANTTTSPVPAKY